MVNHVLKPHDLWAIILFDLNIIYINRKIRLVDLLSMLNLKLFLQPPLLHVRNISKYLLKQIEFYKHQTGKYGSYHFFYYYRSFSEFILRKYVSICRFAFAVRG